MKNAISRIAGPASRGKERKVARYNLSRKMFSPAVCRLPLAVIGMLAAYHRPLTTFLHAAPYHTITVDGDMNDWSSDEIVAADPGDSTFDPGTDKNEIKNLYVTWDRDNLYVGVEGQSNGNGILIYFDVNPGSDRGQGNITKVNTWNRRIIFAGSVNIPGVGAVPFLPDFFFGSWDGSNGNFYAFPSSTSVTDLSGQTSQTASRVSSKPGIEARIPFNTIYSLGAGAVAPTARIACVASLAPGDVGGDVVNGQSVGFGFLGGDSAPNNINGFALTNFATSTLNNFALVTLDANADGVPDNSFSNINKMEITRVNVTPNPFAPGTTGSAKSALISFYLSLPSRVAIKMFDLRGREVRNLVNETVSFSASPTKAEYTWDGRDNQGELVPMGIYIVNIRAESASGGARENMAVAVVK